MLSRDAEIGGGGKKKPGELYESLFGPPKSAGSGPGRRHSKGAKAGAASPGKSPAAKRGKEEKPATDAQLAHLDGKPMNTFSIVTCGMCDFVSLYVLCCSKLACA